MHEPQGMYVVILVVLHRCGHTDVNHFNGHREHTEDIHLCESLVGVTGY